MNAPRSVTPPVASPAQPAAGPRDERQAITSVPWQLTEFQTPARPAPFRTGNGSAPRVGTDDDLNALRERMQEQHVRALADARRLAFEEGRAAGRAEAQQAADQRVADVVSALSSAASAVRQHEEHYTGILEENLVALACAVARQVLQRDVQLEPSAIRVLVQEALAKFPQEDALRVRLHPADHALLAGDAGYPDVVWIADANVVRGGCVVEGRERIVDGRVDLALAEIFRQLTGSDA